MKKITISVPENKVEEVESFIQKLNISILEEDKKLTVDEWQHDTVIKDETTSDDISSDEIEKTSFSREK